MLKYIKYFIIFVIFIVPIYNVAGAGYTCDKKYSSCSKNYYMATSNTNKECNPVSAAGNACLPCPDGYTCAGDTECPIPIPGISFNLNGGNGTAPESITDVSSDNNISLPDGNTTNFYRAGYVLIGWSTNTSATTGSFNYTVPSDYDPSQGIILYAVWQACQSGQYKTSQQKASESCLTPNTGYYASDCQSTNIACISQTICSGSVYCENGLRKNCPTNTTNWTLSTGEGWSNITQCTQTKVATSISNFCESGYIYQNATAEGTWGPTQMDKIKAKPGAFIDRKLNTCTQCSGAVYSNGGTATSCSSCPAQTDGWTRGTGTGWTSYSNCYQTKDATTVSKYCDSGQLKQTASSATAWGEITVSIDFRATRGAYVTETNGTATCEQCEEGYWCAGGPDKPVECPTGTGSPAGSDSPDDCTGECNSITDQEVCLSIPGCDFDAVNKCKLCPSGSYCPGEGIGQQECPAPWVHSAEGSINDTDCYQVCEAKTITGGSLKPDIKNVYYENDCQYNNFKDKNFVTCNNPDDICFGYHFNENDPTEANNACIPNKQSCKPDDTNASSGIKFWLNDESKYGQCYITSCASNYHGNPDGTSTQCETTLYPACDPNQIACSEHLGNCPKSTEFGFGITGLAKWNDKDQVYNYAKCECNTSGEAAGDCGTRNSSCQYLSGTGENTMWGNCTYGNISCQAGCCLETSDSIECSPAPLGYYGSETAGKTVCQLCPAGSTTTTTSAQNINACTITGGSSGTQFCDNNGCFYLPSGINIPY